MKKAAIMVLFAILAICLPSFGYPTALNIIPTADMLGAGQVRIEMENDGYPNLLRCDSERYLLFQFAASDNLELGADLASCDGDSGWLLNGKYRLLSETDSRPAVALGAMGVGHESSPVYYAAGSKSFGRIRLHAGAQRAENEVRAMGGLEYPLIGGVSLICDWVEGAGNFKTVGLYKSFGTFAVNASQGVPNTDGEDKQFRVNVNWTWAPGK